MISLNLELRNKLNLNKEDRFICVENIKKPGRGKYDKILYFLQENIEDEEMVIFSLLKLAKEKTHLLICNVPKVNKRLSNGIMKYNKDLFSKMFEKYKIKRYWFLKSNNRNYFDILFEC
ncbi:hypothetical protein HYV49_05155 [Candidatus Pacearchaeota archaeon]|nr:hypothetical protein [Candidatus Pacearchaeota archaeon]